MQTTLPPPKLAPAYQDCAYIAFALMGALVEPEAAFNMACAALKAKGYDTATIAQARAATEARIIAWGQP